MIKKRRTGAGAVARMVECTPSEHESWAGSLHRLGMRGSSLLCSRHVGSRCKMSPESPLAHSEFKTTLGYMSLCLKIQKNARCGGTCL